MGKNQLIIVVVILIIGALGAFYVSQGKTETSKTPEVVTTQMSPTPQASSSSELTVVGSNYKFDPATITVKKGEMVKITFKSMGGIHDLVVDGYNVRTKTIGSGEQDSLEFTADKVGSFEYYCSVGNHRAMGMKGMLIVE